MISLYKPGIVFFLFLSACQTPDTETAEELIQNATTAYGFDANTYHINFDFRAYHYDLVVDGTYFSYSRTTEKEGIRILDRMSSNEKLKRFENDSLIVIKDSIQQVYTNSLNSVMYFFQLPKPLQDQAVNPLLTGAVEIEGNHYWTLKITFDEQGGGVDFQDEFRYWINKENYQIDYLAYNYYTDGGGTRFRKVKNKRKIKGFLFQDYINYKPANKFEHLDSLPILFQNGELKELSVIENKNIEVD